LSLLKPQGNDTAGKPARLAEIVKISDKYILKGSSVRSPILKAQVGEVGVRITSTSPKALIKSSLISVRTRRARP